MLLTHFIWQTDLKPLSGTNAKNGVQTVGLGRFGLWSYFRATESAKSGRHEWWHLGAIFAIFLKNNFLMWKDCF